MDWPQYFFTASFLKRIAHEIQDRFSRGESLGPLSDFASFVEKAHGSIYVDIKNLELHTSPYLKKWFTESDKRLSPYVLSEAISDNPQIVEMDATESYDSTFTDTFSKGQIASLEQTVKCPIFNYDLINEKWSSISGRQPVSIAEASDFQWEGFLEKYILCTSQILICDKYLLKSVQTVKHNLIPILRACLQLTGAESRITVVSHSNVKSDVLQAIKANIPQGSRVTLVMTDSPKAISDHDRRLITDQLMVNIPVGFDLVDGNGKVKQGRATEVPITSFYSGEKRHFDSITEARKRIVDVIQKQQINTFRV